MRYIDVVLPEDRREPGVLSLVEIGGDVLPDMVMSCPVFGKADSGRAVAKGNPDREQVLQWGDFPLGVYEVKMPMIPETTPASRRSYGPAYIPLHSMPIDLYAAVLASFRVDVPRPSTLEPMWRAWYAFEQHGRYGLAVHAGDRRSRGGYWHHMRPTHGCLRTLNQKMVRLAREVSLVLPAFLICRPLSLEGVFFAKGVQGA